MAGDGNTNRPFPSLILLGIVDFCCILIGLELIAGKDRQIVSGIVWVLLGVGSGLIGYYWPRIDNFVERTISGNSFSRRGIYSLIVTALLAVIGWMVYRHYYPKHQITAAPASESPHVLAPTPANPADASHAPMQTSGPNSKPHPTGHPIISATRTLVTRNDSKHRISVTVGEVDSSNVETNAEATWQFLWNGKPTLWDSNPTQHDSQPMSVTFLPNSQKIVDLVADANLSPSDYDEFIAGTGHLKIKIWTDYPDSGGTTRYLVEGDVLNNSSHLNIVSGRWIKKLSAKKQSQVNPPPATIVNSAPNGIAISGGNVQNPTVNNYGPLARRLSQQQKQELADCIGQKIGQFGVVSIPNSESQTYAQDWLDVFNAAQWVNENLENKQPPIETVMIMRGFFSGIRITVHDGTPVGLNVNKQQVKLIPGSAEENVYNCLRTRTDIPGGGGFVPRANTPTGYVGITVGDEPPNRTA
jgi:hypothetical protein